MERSRCKRSAESCGDDECEGLMNAASILERLNAAAAHRVTFVRLGASDPTIKLYIPSVSSDH